VIRWIKPFNSKKAGFSLLEIIVALAILFILASITFPDFRKVYRTYKFNSYAYQLESLVRYAKMVAMEKSVHVSICVDTSSKVVSLYNETTSRDPDCRGELISQLKITDDWVSLTYNGSFKRNESFGGATLFDPRGLAVLGGNICIDDGTRKFKTVFQNNRGTINIETGQGTCP